MEACVFVFKRIFLQVGDNQQLPLMFFYLVAFYYENQNGLYLQTFKYIYRWTDPTVLNPVIDLES